MLRHASKRVLATLRESDENFVDLAGAVRLHLPGVLVDRNDLVPPPARAAGGPPRNPFSDRNSLVVRTLLAGGPDRSWSIQSLAAAAGVSLATTSYVVRALAEEGLVETTRGRTGKHVDVLDRDQLIQRWTRFYDWTMNRRLTVAAPVGAPARFLRRLEGALRRQQWALTLQAGASLVAPHAAWDHVHVYLPVATVADLNEASARLGWAPDTQGRLTLMAPYYRESVWHDVQKVDGLFVVSTLQLVLDLWHYPVRGREQAEHLLKLSARDTHRA
ncbi:MAG: Rrf2 family transcriptional regulator [Gemmatimonadaceae bacterium]|nr:Rrf2 family transcriptional regulator [Gemmatimonadaceae bacterium]